MRFNFKPRGVCSSRIEFDINGEEVTNVVFYGGCDGNLKAVSKLIDGMTVDEIQEKLSGNTCGRKSTSCADQLARAVRSARDEVNGKN